MAPDNTSYKHFVGPVPSRRLGWSPGVDLTPARTCSMDCIFCQLGRTTCKADVVKVTLAAPGETLFRRIHRPCHGITLEQVLEGGRLLRAELAGELWLEVFLLWGINATPAEVRRLAALARELRPDRVHRNTCVRPPAEDVAQAVPPEHLAALATQFEPTAEVAAEFAATGTAKARITEGALLALRQRRPCTAGQLGELFGLHANETAKYLGRLLRTHRIRSERREQGVYYMAEAQGAAATPDSAGVASGEESV